MIKFIELIKLSIEKSLSKKSIISVFDFIKNKIIEQVKTELSGEEKKQIVDNAVISFVSKNIKSANPINVALVNILIDYIPILTQCIYDYLSKHVDGLTEV